jgi:hypothetical protein
MWQVSDGLASLGAGGLTASVNLLNPPQGISGIQFGETPLHSARLFQLRQLGELDPQHAPDFFVRGGDLVVTYERDDVGGLHREIYWRYIRYDDLSAVGVELIVSVHTDLLEDQAALQIDSLIPARESLCALDQTPTQFTPIAPGGHFASSQADRPGSVALVLHRLANRAGSCVEMVHPADFTSLQVRHATAETQQSETHFTLFAETMEKGVIRRARAQTLFLPSENDLAVAAECYRRFAASPPPLTV